VPLYREQHPEIPVNDLDWLRSELTVFVNGRWLPPANLIPVWEAPYIGLIGDEVAYALLKPEQLTYCSPNTLEECLETWKTTLPRRQAEGQMVHFLWDLVEQNAEQLRRDHQAQAAVTSQPARSLSLVGPAERLAIDPSARVDPMVVADTTQGPVTIDRDTVVAAFSRLEGPCYIGPRTHVLGARIRAGTTVGPNCRIGGEVEASIIQGNANKYHEGFLGHSYVGEWVNFGAGTQNSDLRNDYGDVRVTVQGRQVATGLTKVGSFIGDHTKTGLGTLLNTGSNVGAFCNLLPAGTLLPRYFPSFCSYWNGAVVDKADLPGLLRTAREVMRRRDTDFSSAREEFYRALYRETATLRQRTMLAAERPGRKRSA
jgi:UDP-N-acetylglucosamine diphosphorylase/glucosamine-1-phosphate N-acetyltransferase